MSAVAELAAARRALAAAAQQVARRREDLARRLVFGKARHDEVLGLCSTVEAVAELEHEVERWQRRRELMRIVVQLPRLEGEVAEADRVVEARRLELEAKLTALRRQAAPVSSAEERARAMQRSELSTALHNNVRPRGLSERLFEARQAFAKLLPLLPPERVAAHEVRERAHGLAVDRLRRAERRLAELDARPLMERARERLAQIGGALAALAGPLLPDGAETTQDAVRAGEIEAARAREAARRGAAANSAEVEQDQLRQQIARLEAEARSPERAETTAAAQAEVEAARAELAHVTSTPELIEELVQEFNEWESEAPASQEDR